MIALALTLLIGSAQQPQVSAFTKELRQIVTQSQNARKPGVVLSLTEQDQFFAGHAPRLKRVREMISRDYLQSGEDYVLAATVMHFGPMSDDALVAHELALVGAMKGRFSSLTAIGQDLYLLKCGRKQRFGTQFVQDEGGSAILDYVDEEKPTAVTDAHRLDFAVPPLKVSMDMGLASMTEASSTIQTRLRERLNVTWIETMALKPVALELHNLAKAADDKARIRVLDMYGADGISTPEDYVNAAVILSGSSEPVYLLLAHEFASIAAMRQHPRAPRLFAETMDAYLVSVKDKPRYGTRTGTLASISVGSGVLRALKLR